MKKLFICLALAASILFSGCGGEGVTTPIKPPVVNPVVPPVDPPIIPPVVPPLEPPIVPPVVPPVIPPVVPPIIPPVVPPVEPPIVVKRAWPGTIAFRDYFNHNTGSANLYFIQFNKQVAKISNNFSSENIAWSPNGQYLVGRKNSADPNYSLPIIINRQGQEVATSTKQFAGNSGLLSWTPDSTQIIFSVYNKGIYSLSVNGVEREVMPTAGFTYDHNEFFDYSGSYIYFIHHKFGTEATLCRATIAQFNAGFQFFQTEDIVSFTTELHDENMDFIPLSNGKIIIDRFNHHELVDPEAKTITDIATFFSDSLQIKLSPDSNYLAVNTYQGIKILNASSFGLVRTFALTHEQEIAWSPDSDAVVSADLLLNSLYQISGTKLSINWISDGKIDTLPDVPASSALTRTRNWYASLNWTR